MRKNWLAWMRRFFPGELTLTAEEAAWTVEQAERLRQSGRRADQIWQSPDSQLAESDRRSPQGLALLCLLVADDIRFRREAVDFSAYLEAFGESRRMVKWILLLGGRNPQDLLGDSVQERIGQGGFGVVFKVWRERLNREEAVKVVPRSGYDPLAEARYHFDSPSVLRIYSVDQDRDGDFLIRSELLAGSLANRLRDGSVAEWPEKERVRVIAKVAHACQLLHAEEVCHLDIKPSNILLKNRNSVLEPVLADFSVAKCWTDTGRPMSGSWPYAAPEQWALDSIDARADVYALGRTLQEVLSGKPFAGGPELTSEVDDIESLTRPLDAEVHEPPSHRGCTSDPGLQKILDRCLESDRGKRFLCGGDVGEALDQWLLSRETRLDSGRPRLATGAILTVALALATAAVVFASSWFDDWKTKRPSAAMPSLETIPAAETSVTSDAVKTVVLPFELVVARKGHRVDRQPYQSVLNAVADESGNPKSLDDYVACLNGKIYSLTVKYTKDNAARFPGKFYVAGSGSPSADRWKVEKAGDYWVGTYKSNHQGDTIVFCGGALQDELCSLKEMRFEVQVEYAPADPGKPGLIDLAPADTNDPMQEIVPLQGREYPRQDD